VCLCVCVLCVCVCNVCVMCEMGAPLIFWTMLLNTISLSLSLSLFLSLSQRERERKRERERERERKRRTSAEVMGLAPFAYSTHCICFLLSAYLSPPPPLPPVSLSLPLSLPLSLFLSGVMVLDTHLRARLDRKDGKGASYVHYGCYEAMQPYEALSYACMRP
jgi:hypothetical protein